MTKQEQLQLSLSQVWLCPSCKKNEFTLNLDLQLSGMLQCNSCQNNYPICDEVLDVTGKENSEDLNRIKSAYDDIWNFAEESWSEGDLSGEKAIFDWLKHNSSKKQILLDAGCGSGRHMKNWFSFHPDLVIFLEISDVINVAVRKYRATPDPKPRALFIKSSIEQMPFRAQSIDTSWSAGVISVIENQEDALKALFYVTKKLNYLGLPTEKSLSGKVYLLAEPLRWVLSFFNSEKAALFIAAALAHAAMLVIRVVYLFSFLLAASTKESFSLLVKNPQSAKRLQSSFFDIVRAPRIRKKKDSYYVQIAQNSGYQLNQTKLNTAVEYFEFQRIKL